MIYFYLIFVSGHRSHCPERASVSDLKDAAAPRCSQSFLCIFSNEHQKVPPVNFQQKRLVKGICGTLDIKSNLFGPVIPIKPNKVLNIRG